MLKVLSMKKVKLLVDSANTLGGVLQYLWQASNLPAVKDMPSITQAYPQFN